MAPPQLKKIIKLDELIKDTIDGELIEQTVAPLLPPGENYGSVMYKVDFKVKNNKKNGKVVEYNAVGKCIPPNQPTQDIFNVQVTFKAEIGWYTTVIPTLRNFLKENGIKKEIDYFQKFYGARINLDPNNSDVVDENGIMLTENLSTLGYKVGDRHQGFDLKTSKFILKKLASFHAIPIALKLKDQSLFNEKIRPYLPNIDMSTIGHMHVEAYTDIFRQIKHWPEIVPYIERIENRAAQSNAFIDESITKEPWGSISHNDFWVNNMMLKYDDAADKQQPDKLMILDLQIPCYGSIALDVVFFLSTSVALNVIRTNMDNLIDYYWNEFIENLKRLNVDTTMFPYAGFLNELKDGARNSQFKHALFHTRPILLEKGKSEWDSGDANFKKEDFKKTTIELNEAHKKKYIWLITEYAKRDWI